MTLTVDQAAAARDAILAEEALQTPEPNFDADYDEAIELEAARQRELDRVKAAEEQLARELGQ